MNRKLVEDLVAYLNTDEGKAIRSKAIASSLIMTNVKKSRREHVARTAMQFLQCLIGEMNAEKEEKKVA